MLNEPNILVDVPNFEGICLMLNEPNKLVDVPNFHRL